MHYVITVLVFIVWIVYITNTNKTQLTLSDPTELRQQKTANAVAAITPLDPKQENVATVSITINAIDRVGLVCCLATMLFFAAPLSNLVSGKIVLPLQFMYTKVMNTYC